MRRASRMSWAVETDLNLQASALSFEDEVIHNVSNYSGQGELVVKLMNLLLRMSEKKKINIQSLTTSMPRCASIENLYITSRPSNSPVTQETQR